MALWNLVLLPRARHVTGESAYALYTGDFSDMDRAY